MTTREEMEVKVLDEFRLKRTQDGWEIWNPIEYMWMVTHTSESDTLKSVIDTLVTARLEIERKKEGETELELRRLEGKAVSEMLGIQENTTIDEIVASIGKLQWERDDWKKQWEKIHGSTA